MCSSVLHIPFAPTSSGLDKQIVKPAGLMLLTLKDSVAIPYSINHQKPRKPGHALSLHVLSASATRSHMPDYIGLLKLLLSN